MFSKRWTKYTVIFLVWTLLGMYFVVQNYIYSASTDRGFDWVQNINYRLSNYWMWALFTPLVYYLTRKFKFENPRRLKNIFIVILLGIGISFAHSFLSILLSITLNWSAGKIPEGIVARLQAARFAVVGGTFDSLFMYSIIIGIIYSFEYYKKNREHQLHVSELEKKLAQAELQALKMQLHPHFLFNTLHAISTLMHRDADAADKMITRLSDLLRISLDNIGVQQVTLKDEMEFIEKYIEIQKIRFQDTLNVKVNIASETLNMMVPNLILQPIIENAFKHGIRSNLSLTEIDISSKLNNGNLILSVMDNGSGLNNNKNNSENDGVGLNNTMSRLNQLYGDNYEFNFNDRAGGGFQVLIKIPAVERNDHAS